MRAALLCVVLAGCYQSASDDDAAPVATSIPTAAEAAVGADYPPPGAGPSSGTTGIPECDAYIRKVQDCTNVPPSTRSALMDAAKAMREQASQATTDEKKEAMRESCKAASEALSICDTHL